jgi:hypothetical protein
MCDVACLSEGVFWFFQFVGFLLRFRQIGYMG